MWALIVIFLVTLTALTDFSLGILVLIRNPRKWIHRIYFILAFLMAFWCVCLLLYEYPIIFSSVFWIKTTYLVVTLCTATILLFSFIFPTFALKKAWGWAIIFNVIYLIFTIWLLFFTKFWIINTAVLPDLGLQTIWGPGYYYWLLFIWSCVIWICVNFMFKNRRASGLEKMQLKYFFYAMGLWAVIVAFPDIVMPLFFNNTRYFSISPVSSLAFAFSVAYAILKHHLMDIRLVIARAASYTLLSVFIIIFYTASLFFIGHWIFPTTLNNNQLTISVALALIVAYTFQPIRRYLEKITENIFFKENYDSQELLGKISRILASTIELDSLAKKSLKQLSQALHLEFSLFFLTKNKNLNQINFNNHELESIISHKSNLIIFDEIGEGSFKEMMREKKAGCFVKLIVKGEIIGILALGNKLSGDMYNNTDLRVLEILAPQLAVAFQNAQQYEEIKQFGQKMKIKVDEATKELQVVNEKLKVLDKRKDEFLSIAAHELRAPMTAIKGYLSMIIDGDSGKISSKTSDLISGAVEGSDRLIRLVNNMLNVSRIEEDRMVYNLNQVQVGDLAEKVVKAFELEAEKKGLKIIYTKPSSQLPTIQVDADRLEEVIANLISNAIKYTDKGTITISLSRKDSKIHFAVADTGPGIKLEDQKKLFGKFTRGSTGGGKAFGSGLGLYISKLLVEKFGGKIGFETQIGKRSIFWFELPVKK